MGQNHRYARTDYLIISMVTALCLLSGTDANINIMWTWNACLMC